MKFKFNHVILGGTFDHLHKGHKAFISSAFEHSERVTIGLVYTNLFQKKVLPSVIQPYDQRLFALEEFLKSQNYLSRSRIIRIDDVFGNALEEEKIDAIFVTEHGYVNTQLINEKREETGFHPLEIVKVAFVKNQNGELIASTSIRLGKTNREGEAYLDLFDRNLALPDGLREALRKPFGTTVKVPEVSLERFSLAVGDIVTTELIKHGNVPDISIFDYKTEQHAIYDQEISSLIPSSNLTIANPPGIIAQESVKALYEKINEAVIDRKKFAIKVMGEEDLLALPSILFAPLGSYVFYGLRGIGMVKVVVTEGLKDRIVKDFLKYFIPA